MNFKQFLLEMPITKFQLMGNWDKNAPKRKWSDVDSDLLQSPKAVDRIHKKWSNTKENFELYFVRSKEASKFQQVGKVNKEWVKENLGFDINPALDTITIIYCGNIGGFYTQPMTAWTIAHRMAHSLLGKKSNYHFEEFITTLRRDFQEALEGIYNKTYNKPYSYTSDIRSAVEKDVHKLAKHMGTMKSARDKHLNSFYEFCYELVAQYIITGHIKFNEFPRKAGKDLYNRISHPEDAKEWKEIFDTHARTYEHMLDSVFGTMLNGIYVM